MKKLSLFTLLITLIFISCSKDDDASNEESSTNKDLIIGKWNVTAITDIPNDDCELLSTLEIKADGTYEEQTYGGFAGGVNCTPDDLDKGTWKLSGNILTLTLDKLGNAISLTTDNTILELTETTLKYEFEYTEEGQTFKEAWTYTKNDDTSNLIGTWELTYRKENNNTSPNTLDNCEKTSTIEFKPDNTYTEKTFVEISGNCASDGEFSGSWLESDNQLTLNFIENDMNTTNISKFSIVDDELTLVFDEITEKYRKK